MFPNPTVVLKATVRNDVFLLELRERHKLLLQTFGNLGEPNRIWRQLSSAVFAEADEARVNSIEALGFFWCKRGRR